MEVEPSVMDGESSKTMEPADVEPEKQEEPVPGVEDHPQKLEDVDNSDSGQSADSVHSEPFTVSLQGSESQSQTIDKVIPEAPIPRTEQPAQPESGDQELDSSSENSGTHPVPVNTEDDVSDKIMEPMPVEAEKDLTPPKCEEPVIDEVKESVPDKIEEPAPNITETAGPGENRVPETKSEEHGSNSVPVESRGPAIDKTEPPPVKDTEDPVADQTENVAAEKSEAPVAPGIEELNSEKMKDPVTEKSEESEHSAPNRIEDPAPNNTVSSLPDEQKEVLMDKNEELVDKKDLASGENAQLQSSEKSDVPEGAPVEETDQKEDVMDQQDEGSLGFEATQPEATPQEMVAEDTSNGKDFSLNGSVLAGQVTNSVDLESNQSRPGLTKPICEDDRALMAADLAPGSEQASSDIPSAGKTEQKEPLSFHSSLKHILPKDKQISSEESSNCSGLVGNKLVEEEGDSLMEMPADDTNTNMSDTKGEASGTDTPGGTSKKKKKIYRGNDLSRLKQRLSVMTGSNLSE